MTKINTDQHALQSLYDIAGYALDWFSPDREPELLNAQVETVGDSEVIYTLKWKVNKVELK